ncbi:MAG: protein-methionine-sulfoxide reductase catalytic subunit MsrP, partial [Methylobacteriaceae bacterium]|nr:protein-methionine-sulfoxide reductase catalytic subunit MsrP [Methylobacteriaceae bacterium]
MLISRRKSWMIPEREATPEALLMSRRALIAGGAALVTAGCSDEAAAQRVGDDPTIALYPVKRNEAYKVSSPITAEAAATRYNNFIELGSGKSTWRVADSLKIRPWTVRVDGLVETPQTFDIDDLIRSAQLEERVYRLRCVETWSAVIPWTGFPLAALLARAKPLSAARYVRFETFMEPKMALGQRSRIYPWPYVEGITIAEAQHDLAFLVTGAYGKPLPKQMGAPLRLALPWKYGFKSIKSIVKISL